ncbi:hypothetical protein HQN87_14870 [Paenibacillus tritici]|uniref:Uncharacterized protein n=2 Tax=Paenibacillus tritici TaxID=1873425 RepID=A0ABX2DSS1_9BACL|nr:hypothetical protein [Paenibacillus tritici]
MISHLESLLRLSDTEQRSTLLRLMVKKITVDPNKRIDRNELAFDEESQEHFLNAAPSGVKAPEGAFSLRGGKTL